MQLFEQAEKRVAYRSRKAVRTPLRST